MSIVVTVKIREGIAIASDSKRSKREWPSGKIVERWFDCRKIFEISKEFPVAFACYGLAKIGETPLHDVMRELAKKLKGEGPFASDWALLKNKYTLAEIAQKARKFIYEDHYLPTYSMPSATFRPLVVQTLGFSAKSQLSEVYSMDIRKDTGFCEGPILHMTEEECDVACGGDDEGGIIEIFNRIVTRICFECLFSVDMPLNRASVLAERLVFETIRASEMHGQESSIGGPVVVATISKREGFRWVRSAAGNEPP